MTKYEKNQKLEIFGLTDPNEKVWNGEVVIVLALPGYNKGFPEAYGVLAKDGLLHGVNPRNLRPYPPSIPGGRKDLDNKTSWAEFDKETGLDSSTFRKDAA